MLFTLQHGLFVIVLVELKLKSIINAFFLLFHSFTVDEESYNNCPKGEKKDSYKNVTSFLEVATIADNNISQIQIIQFMSDCFLNE